VTEGGHAKCLALASVPVVGRGRSGVRVSREPVAARIINLASGDIVTTAAVAAAVGVDRPRGLHRGVACGPARRALDQSGVQVVVAAQRTRSEKDLASASRAGADVEVEGR